MLDKSILHIHIKIGIHLFSERNSIREYMRRRKCIPLMVISHIREKNETADEAEIAAVFEEKYPEFSRNV